MIDLAVLVDTLSFHTSGSLGFHNVNIFQKIAIVCTNSVNKRAKTYLRCSKFSSISPGLMGTEEKDVELIVVAGVLTLSLPFVLLFSRRACNCMIEISLMDRFLVFGLDETVTFFKNIFRFLQDLLYFY